MPDQYLTLIEQEKAPPLPQRGRRVLYVDTLGILREEDHQGRIMVIGSGLANTSGTTVKVGTTSTGAAGSQAIVTNSGTDTAVVLNFTIPQGSQGDPGVGVPSGGTTGQVATKASNTDFDIEWTTVPGVTDGDKGDVTVSSSGSVWTIDANAVTNAKLANVSTSTLKGRVSASTGAVEDLTGTQATTLLDVFTSALKGLAPASGGGTTNFLRADGSWASPPAGTGRYDIQVFNAGSGNWTKPSNADPNGWAEVVLISGGGGGGSGRRDAAGTQRGGGGGGASGNVVRAKLRVSSLGATEAYTVGAGGTGGPAPVTDTANGVVGGNGGSSSFAGFSIAGGIGGGGGIAGVSSGGTTTVGASFVDNLVTSNVAGGNGGGATAGTAGTSSSILLTSAGGGAGGVTTGNLNGAGGAGGAIGSAGFGTIAGGTAGAGNTAGGTVPIANLKWGYGIGGGGAGGNNAGGGPAGGNGTGYGGGGGGSGGGTNGATGAAGGNGSAGVLIVMTPLT